MFRRKPKPKQADECVEQEKAIRLEDAEKRANVLFEKAAWVHAVVVRRDRDNHWQAAVNELFLGGNP